MKIETAIFNRDQISPLNRIDAEFYRGMYSNFEHELNQKPNKKFSDICKESTEKINPEKNPNEYFNYLEITDINLLDGSFYLQKIIGEQAPSRARKKCCENDLIISTVRPNRNAVAIIKDLDSKNLVCSTGFCVLKTCADLSPEEIFIFLKSKYAIVQLTRRMRATMYPAVANIDILDISVPLFSEKLKKRIANETKRIFDLRRDIVQLTGKIDQIVKELCDSIICDFDIQKFDYQNNIKIIKKSEVFSDKNRMDSEFYRNVFEKIDCSLEKYGSCAPIGKFFPQIFTGKTPAKAEYSESEELEYSIIKVGTLTNIGINWSNVEYVTSEFFNENKKFIVKENDVLLTSSAHSLEHIGAKVDVVRDIPLKHKKKCLFVGEIMALRGKKEIEIEPYYIASFLRTELGRIQLQRCTRGISAHIYDRDIPKYVKVPIPSESMIKEISKIARDVETKKNEAISKVIVLKEEYEKEIGL